VVRRLGTPLGGLTSRTPDDRPYPPGQHGPALARRRRRASPFAARLAEKQKIRFYYGVSETQLRRYLARAARQRGATGENLLRLLEKRLDNVVFRLGLAATIPAARQLVTHRHVLLNGRVASIPSQEVSVDDRISLRPRSARHPAVLASAEVGPAYGPAGYLEAADDGRGGRMRAEPARRDVILDVRESLVVEHYAR
jgi:small subunit ribosomal protein S4